jgi:hypothetical protein
MVTITRNHQAPTAILSEADLEALAASYITPEFAHEAQIRRVSSQQAADILIRPDSGSLSGLAFPYLRPGEAFAHLERIRLDSPLLISKGGKIKIGEKYLTAQGSRNRLYFMPGTDPALLSDISGPIVITDGEKRTIALHRLAWENTGGVQ